MVNRKHISGDVSSPATTCTSLQSLYIIMIHRLHYSQSVLEHCNQYLHVHVHVEFMIIVMNNCMCMFMHGLVQYVQLRHNTLHVYMQYYRICVLERITM